MKWLSQYEIYVDESGMIYSKKGQPRKLYTTPRGYLNLNVKENGKWSPRFVHRLVATAFIPNPLNKPHINHLDGNKQNNTVENLEWCTPAENVAHARDVLKVYRGQPAWRQKWLQEHA